MTEEDKKELEEILARLEQEPTTEVAGYINVNAGMCWIGDPCEFVPDEGEDWGLANNPQAQNWKALCKEMRGKNPAITINEKDGFEGVGVVVSTGDGDGYYPVTVKRDGVGRIMSATIEFMKEREK
ncbi:MAG: hypothetical protein CL995_04845 [Euryarchaeota archaeon]|nr:hypothetical protein [Euryarchaeota archaeon]|tara:strand:- start:323 stop:700 length:378 start_codon:yes stop_codon:yes gene_type:complete